MKPAEVPVGSYLGGNYRLVVPSFQRPYEWQLPRWLDLWRDISQTYVVAQRLQAAGAQPFPRAHFMGSVIVQEMGSLEGGIATEMVIVDGQQRLLTLLALASAMRDHAAYLQGGQIAPDNTLSVIRNEWGGEVRRVEVRQVNKRAYEAMAAGQFKDAIPDQLYREGLVQVYRFFRYQLWRGTKSVTDRKAKDLTPPTPARARDAPARGSYEPWGEPASEQEALFLPLLSSVLMMGLKLLEMKLDDSDEEASTIFETMNSKSTALRQFDLLRNSVFVRLPTRRAEYHDDYWQPAEDGLGRVTYRALRKDAQDQFLYEYIISLGETEASSDNLHRKFTERVIDELGYESSVENEQSFWDSFAIPLAQAAVTYPLVVGNKDTASAGDYEAVLSPDELSGIRALTAMSGGPPAPILLAFFRKVTQDPAFRPLLLEVLRDIQSYIVREMLTGQGLSPLRATFMQVAGDMSKDYSLATLRSSLRRHDWKTDAQVLAAVTSTPLYSFGAPNMFPVLQGIERALSGGGAHPLQFGNGANLYSVEHVYPQAGSPGRDWLADMATWAEPADRELMDLRKHVLGNLTAVTNYENSRNARKRFLVKKEMISQAAPLRVHGTITDPQTEKWTSEEIDSRSLFLASVALEWWPRQDG